MRDARVLFHLRLLTITIREQSNMSKQKTRRARTIHQAPNDAGVIGDRIADLMLHPFQVAADAVKGVTPAVAKQIRSKRRSEGKTRATAKEPRK